MQLSSKRGTPSAATVKRWREKTPPDFIFAAKVPQVIKHDRVLVDCDAKWKNFLATMELLGEKLGPPLFRFGHFNNSVFRSADDFVACLKPFLKKLPKDHRFAVEVRNKSWLDARFAEALREHNVALALIDQSWMPRPWETVTTFLYLPIPLEGELPMGRVQRCTVRFLNGQGIERSTQVEASSVFDAVCRGWAKFKSSGETFDESFRAEEFIVEVHEAPKTYKVSLENLLRWVDGRGRSPADGLQRKRLRNLLDANLPD